jgi:hypothetical protein
VSLLTNEALDDTSEPKLIFFKGKTETKFIAIGVILAAVYGMASLVPLSVFIGGSGFITMAICISPLFGILLGPWRGFAFGFIAGILASLLAIENIAVWTMLFGPAVTGVFTGLCYRSSTKIRSITVPGPTLTFIFFLIITTLYEIPNLAAWWFIIPHFTAGIIALLLQIRSIDFNPTRDDIFKYLQFLPLVFIGTMVDQSIMMLGAVYIIQTPSDVFGLVIFPAMLTERIIATLVCIVITSAVLKAFEHELFQS